MVEECFWASQTEIGFSVIAGYTYEYSICSLKGDLTINLNWVNEKRTAIIDFDTEQEQVFLAWVSQEKGKSSLDKIIRVCHYRPSPMKIY